MPGADLVIGIGRAAGVDEEAVPKLCHGVTGEGEGGGDGSLLEGEVGEKPPTLAEIDRLRGRGGGIGPPPGTVLAVARGKLPPPESSPVSQGIHSITRGGGEAEKAI